MIAEVRSPSVTSWQAERDRLLDYISYQSGKISDAETYLLKLEEDRPELAFEIGELYLILAETKIDNDIRRGFDNQPTDVVASGGTEKKEEQE